MRGWLVAGRVQVRASGRPLAASWRPFTARRPGPGAGARPRPSLCGQWLLLQASMSRALGPELSKMGKSEAFPNESSHSRPFWKWCRGAMRRVWGQSKWRHGLGCPNQMNEEQGVPGNDNRTRGERERESVLGNGLRWAKRAKKKKKKNRHPLI